VARSHILIINQERNFGIDSSMNVNNGAVIICNDGIEYADSLFQRRWSSERRSQRLSRSSYWVAFDLFHALNDWPAVLEKATLQVKIKVCQSTFAVFIIKASKMIAGSACKDSKPGVNAVSTSRYRNFYGTSGVNSV
jgi:hypothetical protein